MSKNEILKKIESLLEELGIGCNEGMILFDEMDSLKFISLVVELEEHFGIEIPDEYLNILAFDSLENIADIVINLMEVK
jgi:acyl carrier protein